MTNRNGKDIWKCLDCPHYLYDKELLIGRVARCYHCSSPFKIDVIALEKAKLRCDDCVSTTREEVREEATEVLILNRGPKFGGGTPQQEENLLKKVFELAKPRQEEIPSLEDQQTRVIRDLIRSESEQVSPEPTEKG